MPFARRTPTHLAQRSLPPLRLLALAAVTLVGAALGPRAAQASPAGQKKHLEAIEALKESRFARARRLWREAYSIDRTPKYLYNIAKMSEELEQFVEALEQYERFIQETGRKPGLKLQLSKARERVEALLKKIVILRIVVLQPGVQVIVDERVLGTGPLDKQVRLPAGRHVVTASRKGFHGQSHTLTLDDGARPRLELTLTKIKVKVVTRKTKMKYPLPRWLPWTGLGFGLAMAGSGGITLGWAQKRFNDWDKSVELGAPVPSYEREAKLCAKLGYSFLSVGGLIAVVSVVGLFLNRPRLVPVDDAKPGPRPAPQAGVTIIPLISPTSLGLVLQF